MPKYIVGNYYSGCVTHEVEAQDQEVAVQIGRDLPASDADLLDCLHYDESLVVEEVEVQGENKVGIDNLEAIVKDLGIKPGEVIL